MRRHLIIAGIAIIALVVIGGGAALLVDRSPSLQNAIEQRANLNRTTTNISQNTNTQPVAKPDPDRETILFVSRNFTEQYGSSTSDDGYAGVLRAADWTTAAMRTQLQNFVNTQRAGGGTTYRSTLTKALVLSVTRQTVTAATVRIDTERQETIGADVQTYNQTLTVGLVKQGTDWKVDAAVWQPR